MTATVALVVAGCSTPTATPSAAPTSEPIVVMLATGESFQVSAPGWEVTRQSVFLSGVYVRDTLGYPYGEIDIEVFEGAGEEECASAASCAAVLVSRAGGEVEEREAGDVTYYLFSLEEVFGGSDGGQSVVAGTMVWYVDWEGQVYELYGTWRKPGGPWGAEDESLPTKPDYDHWASLDHADVVTKVVESVDWTGTHGTPVLLPSGRRIGVGLPEGWTVGSRAAFDSVDETAETSLRRVDCSSAAACSEETPLGDWYSATSHESRTINGVTYHLTGWHWFSDSYEYEEWLDNKTDPEVVTWDCEHDGNLYRFMSEGRQGDSFMESVEWIGR